MKLIKRGEGHPHEVKGHFGQWGMGKLQIGKDSQRVGINLSHFLPQGGTEMMPAPMELAYYCLSGSLQVKGRSEEHLLEPGDLLYIAPGEEREIHALGTEPSTILVVLAKVD